MLATAKCLLRVTINSFLFFFHRCERMLSCFSPPLSLSQALSKQCFFKDLLSQIDILPLLTIRVWLQLGSRALSCSFVHFPSVEPPLVLATNKLLACTDWLSVYHRMLTTLRCSQRPVVILSVRISAVVSCWPPISCHATTAS